MTDLGVHPQPLADNQAWAKVALDGGVLWAYGEHTGFYAASLIKVPVAIAVLREVDRGTHRIDSAIQIRPSRSPISGSEISIDEDSRDPLLATHAESELALTCLVERSIVVSSNEASNLLLDLVGFDAVNAVLGDVGARGSSVNRHLFDAAPSAAIGRNVATAYDYAQLFAALIRGDLLTPSSTVLLRALLLAQQDRVAIPNGTPGVGVSNGSSGSLVGNKTGSTSSVGHDVAFVEPADAPPYCLAVLTSGGPLEDPNVSLSIAAIAKHAYEHGNR